MRLNFSRLLLSTDRHTYITHIGYIGNVMSCTGDKGQAPFRSLYCAQRFAEKVSGHAIEAAWIDRNGSPLASMNVLGQNKSCGCQRVTC